MLEIKFLYTIILIINYQDPSTILLLKNEHHRPAHILPIVTVLSQVLAELYYYKCLKY